LIFPNEQDEKDLQKKDGENNRFEFFSFTSATFAAILFN